ncbi:uncharacterized protein LOC126814466 [Patella vulgata]|uniref:uncharacterized protein LOC126814466 n=1 Tax=Patella vulgata TaxID=6465 RepID=UPI00217F75B2|nr:uncharacterized protein LOC126814466 [Patella vulgata]
MAENNQKRSTVQTDLLEAFARYEEDEGDVDTEYDAAMFEVMDESLNSLTQMFSRQKSRRLSLDEQNRRIRDLNGLMKDSAFQSSMSSYNKVMGNLRNAFQRVWKQEDEIDAETKRLAVERRLLMQEQLVRKHATKWVNAASAKERQRQIQDFEVSRYKSDPFRDAVKLALAKAQREMILQKFNGKWVDTRTAPGDGTPKEELSEYDKKMKAMRMKSRRKSCVVSREEDAD